MDFDDLVALVEAKLATMDPVFRARLVKKLQSSAKKEGALRVSDRAKRFARQRGRCAECSESITTTGPALWMVQTEGQPIRCRACIGVERVSQGSAPPRGITGQPISDRPPASAGDRR